MAEATLAGASPIDEDAAVAVAGGSSPSSAPYSVAKYRLQRQLDAAATANDTDAVIRRMTHAIKEAQQGEVGGLALYQEELATIHTMSQAESWKPPSLLPMGLEPPLRGITPRRLPPTPSEVRSRIEVGDAASVVGLLTLSDAGVAELRDASQIDKGVVASVQVFDPSQLPDKGPLVVLPRGSGVFNHLALRDLVEEQASPFARLVAVIDPDCLGSQLLVSQLLRHGPQGPLNSVVCALPATVTEAGHVGPEHLPLVASLCLGSAEFGMGRGESGCVFGRAVAIVERGTALSQTGVGWPFSVASVALAVAALGTEVEERPASKGQWLFHPPAPESLEEAEPPPAPAAEAGEEGEEGGEAEPAPAADGAEGDEAQEKPPEPEKATYTGTNVHAWLFNGLNQCYASGGSVEKLCAGGVPEDEARGCKEWLAKVERAGFWGPVVGVREETKKRIEDERIAREEAKRQAKREARAEKKRLADEAAAAAAAADGAEGAEGAATE